MRIICGYMEVLEALNEVVVDGSSNFNNDDDWREHCPSLVGEEWLKHGIFIKFTCYCTGMESVITIGEFNYFYFYTG